ncbi:MULTISPECIES: flavin reductase [Vibrio]|uniref:flavin reductase n=1 Tax=Vibrio TaxID=662 RepID=UPI000E699911|nr:flavin reductase [Vibrio sp. PID23_8]RIZ52969.1 peptidase [Vibrio sp. PID23_8]
MQQSNIDPKALRNALGTFTTGVTIITTRDGEGQAVGLTANSFNSVSLDPPLVLWSLAKTALSVPAFTSATHWNVHVLSSAQQELSNRFASKGEDKFSGLELDKGVSDAPLLQQCTARFQCRTAFTHDGGDHIIFIGEVIAFDQQDLPPLAFQSGQYAVTAKKPWQELKLSSASEALECSYSEDLLGYLLGRAHFQMLGRMQKTLKEQSITAMHFFALSVLAIQDDIGLNEINAHVDYTGQKIETQHMDELVKQGAVREIDGRYVLTENGHQAALLHISEAKVIEQEMVSQLGEGDVMALKVILKRLIQQTDPGLPDLWANAS